MTKTVPLLIKKRSFCPGNVSDHGMRAMRIGFRDVGCHWQKGKKWQRDPFSVGVVFPLCLRPCRLTDCQQQPNSAQYHEVGYMGKERFLCYPPIEPKIFSSPHGGGGFRWGGTRSERSTPIPACRQAGLPSPIKRGKGMK